MKLKDLLKLEKFSYLTLLTKDVDLDRNIDIVESTETPDAYKYISENALVITTAMSFKDDQNQLIDFINQLREKMACGLAIKVSRFLIKLDKPIIDYCNAIGFPLFLIPNNITLGNLYTEILSELWDKKEDNLTFVNNTQQIFSSVLRQKQNFSTLLNTLKAILGTEVALIDPFGNIVSCTNYFSPLFTSNQLRQVVKDIIQDSMLKYEKRIQDTSGKMTPLFIYRIDKGLPFPYFLFILTSSKLEPNLCKFVTIQAIFAVSITISMKLNDSQFKLQQLDRSFTDFLQLAKNNKQDKLIKLIQRENLQFFERGRNVILYIPDFEKIFPQRLQQEGYCLIYNFLQLKLEQKKSYKLIPMIFNHYYLVQTDNKDLEQIIKDMNRVINDVKNSIDMGLHIAIGPKYFSLKSMSSSIEDTIDSVHHGTMYKYNDKVKLCIPHCYQKLFSFIPDNQKEYFYEAKLKNLGKNDVTTKELRETLKIWLLNQGNVKKTSEILFIHRNTVHYRIEKCKEILDSDLEDAEEIYNLEIALTLFDEP